MGALHAGHLSLIRRARKQSRLVVVSVFVNPLQFGPAEDLTRYPRKFKTDRRLCREAGVDLLFMPSGQELYPKDFYTSVTVKRLTQRWEGEVRPTHFEGVTTIVTKLLCLIRPQVTYFGQKDYQQYVVVKQLVRDLHFDVKVLRCPTVREYDGLACSSRNQFLGNAQRAQAGLLVKALHEGKKAIMDGQPSVRKIQNIMKQTLARHPEITLDYLAVCHPHTLEPLARMNGTVVLLGAIRLGGIRLIDNLFVSPKRN